jgi:hypothetical protein
MNPNAISKSAASLPSFLQQSPREKFEFCIAHHLEQYNAQKLVSFDMLLTSISLKVAVLKMTTMDKNLSFSILTEKSKALPHGGREAFHSYLIEAISTGYEEVLLVENFLDEIEITSNRPPSGKEVILESFVDVPSQFAQLMTEPHPKFSKGDRAGTLVLLNSCFQAVQMNDGRIQLVAGLRKAKVHPRAEN